MRRCTADTQTHSVVPHIVLFGDIGFVRTKDDLDVFNTELLIRRDAIRELFRIRDVQTGNLLPSELVTGEVVVSRATFCWSNGNTVVKVGLNRLNQNPRQPLPTSFEMPYVPPYEH